MAFFLPILALGFAVNAVMENERRDSNRKAELERAESLRREREDTARRERALEERRRREREQAQKREREAEERRRREREEAAQRERELKERVRHEREEAKKRQREAEELRRREREEAERRQREIEEQLRREEERARAAEAAKELIEANWRAGVHPGVASLTQEQIQQAKSSYLDGKVHIAFVGQSGAGKSTLTNSVRGLKANDAGAATVSQNEGTRKIDRYVDPIHPQCVWYDVPGAGTLECTDWNYFMAKELYAYDIVVVVFSDRIMQNDVRVLANAQELGIPTFLVRTKSDQVIRNMQEDYEEEEDTSRARFVQSTHDYVREVLSQAEGVDANKRVYMVSRDGVIAVVKQGPVSQQGLDEQALVRDILQVQIQ